MARFEVPTVILLKIQVFGDVTPVLTYYFHAQGQAIQDNCFALTVKALRFSETWVRPYPFYTT
jgi:hypothetical protein